MKIDTFKILLGLGRHTKYNTSTMLHGSNASIAMKKYLFWKQYDKFLDENRWLKEIEHIEIVPKNWRGLNKKEPKASLPIDLYLELCKNYPIPIPYPLFFCYGDFFSTWIERKIGTIADKWLMDIFSGDSFYKLNKEYFTRSEAKQFLTCNWLEFFDEQSIYPATCLDLVDLYFYAKINANNLSLPNYIFADTFITCFTFRIVQEYFQFICNNRKHFKDEDEIKFIGKYLEKEYIDEVKDFDFKKISWKDLKKMSKIYNWNIYGVLKNKFIRCFSHKIVEEYLKFIENNILIIMHMNEITDIADFLKSEYIENEQDFDFNGRTWHDLRRLSNEWHEFQRQAREFQRQAGKLRLQDKWEKSKIEDFIFENDGKIWTIKEITTGKLLYDEGKDMHHCVFSFLLACIAGDCFIFSVCCKSKKALEERIATVEISKNLEFIQARGIHNSLLNNETKIIINKWANENKIKQFNLILEMHPNYILNENAR